MAVFGLELQSWSGNQARCVGLNIYVANWNLLLAVVYSVVARMLQGKSQLASQLLLQVQLPMEYGGMNGAAAHISIGNILSQYACYCQE